MLIPPKSLSRTERDRRWQLARDIIQTENLAALIVYGDREAAAPAGFAPDCYFTNDRPGSIVVFIGDEPPRVYTFASLMVADHLQASLRGDLQWIDAEQLFVGKTGPDVGAWLASRRLEGTRIGIIGLEPYPPFYFDGAMPARTFQGLADALPTVTWVPVYREFFRRASVKSEEELALVRYAAHIGETMCEALRATARPGVSEADLVAAVTATCFSMGGYTAELLLGSGPEYVGWGATGLAIPRTGATGVAGRRSRAVGDLRAVRYDGNTAPGCCRHRRRAPGDIARRRGGQGEL
ncbi:Xaa-Pro aminopeptidase [Serratia plymuthica]|uniref:Xaa-Pro aminopeptidase n=1 Tax=Serratia plymuthica TaxID=82996 RepID=A0A2X4TVH3_SERPL|nr:Xaa-Pro aminopeptidase [Serratia plymuthica]